MKIINACIVTFFLALGSVAFAQPPGPMTQSDARPSDESVRRLLEVMQARKLVDAIPKQIDAMFTANLNQLVNGESGSEKERQAIEKMRARLMDITREAFSWNSMEPVYLEIYRKTFSQAEVDSMISFYSSPAGHAVVVKLPLAMQNSMAVMQQRMQALMPKIQQMAKDTAAEIKAQEKSSPQDKTG